MAINCGTVVARQFFFETVAAPWIKNQWHSQFVQVRGEACGPDSADEKTKKSPPWVERFQIHRSQAVLLCVVNEVQGKREDRNSARSRVVSLRERDSIEPHISRWPQAANQASCYMLVPAVSRTRRVVATATAGCVIVAVLASATLSDGVLRYSRHSLEVEQGDSPVIVAVGEQQRGPRRFSALSGTADTLNDCAANDISDEDIVEAFDNTTTLSLGNRVARILTGRNRVGGEEGTWYEDTLATLLVEYCEEEQQSVHHR